MRSSGKPRTWIALGLFACGHGAVGSPGDAAAGQSPRLVAPLACSVVSSCRPLLRWAAPREAVGARIEVCPDRACTGHLMTFETAGDAAQVPEALPRTTVFWRATALLPGGRAGGTSATWPLRCLGASDVHSIVSSGLDVNGDGYEDLAVSWAEQGATETLVDVYRGGPGGLDALQPATVKRREPSAGRIAIAPAGDVNGDGYGDLLIADPSGGGRDEPMIADLFLVLGGDGSLSAPVPVEVDAPGFDIVPGDVRAGFDLDGDAHPDAVVAARAHGDCRPAAIVLRGAPGGFAPRPAALLPAADQGDARFAAGGDVNGDGYADLVVALPDAAGGQAPALHLGGPEGGLAAASILTEPRADGLQAWSLTLAPDATGDGLSDVWVRGMVDGRPLHRGLLELLGDWRPTSAYPGDVPEWPPTAMTVALLFAGSRVPPAGPDQIIGAPAELSLLGRVTRVADFDNDGAWDLALLASRAERDPRTTTSPLAILHGSEAGLAEPRRGYGAPLWPVVIQAGDFDGDGFADLAEAAVDFVGTRHLVLWRGSSDGLLAEVDDLLVDTPPLERIGPCDRDAGRRCR